MYNFQIQNMKFIAFCSTCMFVWCYKLYIVQLVVPVLQHVIFVCDHAVNTEGVYGTL